MVGRAGADGMHGGIGGYGAGGYASAHSHLEDLNRPLYMIGVAAELAGVHPQTLRAYEQKGLIAPQRTSGGTRMYSQADINRLHLINELTEARRRSCAQVQRNAPSSCVIAARFLHCAASLFRSK